MFPFQVVPTTDHIDTEKLKAREQIKFFEEVLLFEDELHDHGVSSLTVKIVSPLWPRVPASPHTAARLRETRVAKGRRSFLQARSFPFMFNSSVYSMSVHLGPGGNFSGETRSQCEESGPWGWAAGTWPGTDGLSTSQGYS